MSTAKQQLINIYQTATKELSNINRQLFDLGQLLTSDASLEEKETGAIACNFADNAIFEVEAYCLQKIEALEPKVEVYIEKRSAEVKEAEIAYLNELQKAEYLFPNVRDAANLILQYEGTPEEEITEEEITE